MVLVGPAVRLSEYVSTSDKRYQAVIMLGKSTDTYDEDGKTTSSSPVNVTEEQFDEVHFLNLQGQVSFLILTVKAVIQHPVI